MADYDSTYREVADLFGSEPTPLLAQFAARIPPGRVLDVGVGQGRNALLLARLGYHVIGIDASGVAVETARRRARAEGLTLDTFHGSVFDYHAPDASFQAVLLFGLLQILARPDIERLLALAARLLSPLGLLFVTAWHTNDPAHERIRSQCTRIGATSYASADGEVRTYFGPGELPGLLRGWQIVHHREDVGPPHRHGDGPIERHGEVNLVAQKQA